MAAACNGTSVSPGAIHVKASALCPSRSLAFTRTQARKLALPAPCSLLGHGFSRSAVIPYVAYADAAVTSSFPDDEHERTVSSSFTSTSQQLLTSVGQSCLTAFGDAVEIAKAQGSGAVGQQHLLLALLRDGKLNTVTDNFRSLQSCLSSSRLVVQQGKHEHQRRQPGVAFSSCVAAALQAATQLARRLGAAAVEAEHVLIALLDSPSDKLKVLLKDSGVDLANVRQQVFSCTHQFSQPQRFSSAAARSVATALVRSPQPGKSIVTTLQLLFGVLQDDSAAADVLLTFGVTPAKLEKFMEEILLNDVSSQNITEQLPGGVFQPDGRILLHRLTCTPQARVALQLALQSSADRGKSCVTSLDMLFGLLKAHTGDEQDWCDKALYSLGANPEAVLYKVLSLLKATHMSAVELQELNAPFEAAWVLLPSYAWN